MVDQELYDFYKDKRIFLTGHTGFKGSWMLLWLHSLNCKIKGYSLSPLSEKDLFNIIEGEKLCDSVISNITDYHKLAKEIEDFQPDVIFHLAAQPLVRRSYIDPIETFETNIIGTANLLNASRSIKKKCSIVIVTTDKVYKNTETNYAFREDDKLGGHDPYSASKAASEIVTDSYRFSYFPLKDYDIHQTSITTVRAGNVIGGGDWSKDRIIPDIVNSLVNNQEIELRNPHAIRPWQFVLDPIRGYLVLAQKLYEEPTTYSGAWNFGPETPDSLSVKEIANLAITEWGTGSVKFSSDQNQPHEAQVLQLNVSKAKKQLSWTPIYSETEAIKKTIQWYKQESQKRKQFTLQQLKEYRSEI